MPADAVTTVRMLSCHAGYACGNSGACCSAGWPIPVETTVLPRLQHALDRGVVGPTTAATALTYPAARPADVGAVLGRTADGTCVFFDRAQPDGCCRVQRRVGQAAMPVACRQFPRLVRHDATGTAVSLSHWCPTALACLTPDVPLAIVVPPPAFAAAATLDGLDARHAWPPLLRPGCLSDLTAHARLEAAAVHLLANVPGPLLARLRAVAALFEEVRAWTPARGPLEDDVEERVSASLAAGQQRDGRENGRVHTALPSALHDQLWTAVLDAVPDAVRGRLPPALRLPATGAAASRHASADAYVMLDAPAMRGRVGRYLAARTFGTWMAYQGEGLRSTLAYVLAALVAVAEGLAVTSPADDGQRRVGEALRTADLLLLHLGAPDVLAARLAVHERAPVVLSASC